jgi:hypothetical protein
VENKFSDYSQSAKSDKTTSKEPSEDVDWRG